jgi:hypothetical protein
VCFFLLERRAEAHEKTEEELLIDKQPVSGVFLFWIGVCSIALNTSHLALVPIGTINPTYNPFFKDASVVAIWLRIPPIGLIIISAVSITAVIFMGFFFGKHFAERFLHNKTELTESSATLKAISSLYILPVLCLLPIVLVLTYPHMPYVHLGQLLVLLWMAAGIAMHIELRAAKMHKVRCVDGTNRKSFDLFLAILLCVFMLKVVFKY